jgi:excisionase family DNA binding protein
MDTSSQGPSSNPTPLTVSVEEAGRMLGIGRGLAYEAAKRGQLPTIRLGRRLVVPRGKLEELLGGPIDLDGS